MTHLATQSPPATSHRGPSRDGARHSLTEKVARPSWPEENLTDNAPVILAVSPLDPFEADAWATRLLNRGETLAASGRFSEAVEAVGLVLALDPHHAVARARLLHHRAGIISKKRKYKKRTDETVRRGPRRTAAPEANPWTAHLSGPDTTVSTPPRG